MQSLFSKPCTLPVSLSAGEGVISGVEPLEMCRSLTRGGGKSLAELASLRQGRAGIGATLNHPIYCGTDCVTQCKGGGHQWGRAIGVSGDVQQIFDKKRRRREKFGRTCKFATGQGWGRDNIESSNILWHSYIDCSTQ